MKIIVLLLALCAVANAFAPPQSLPQLDEFHSFMEKFSKNYTDLNEYMAHYHTFRANLQRIQQLRAAHYAETGTSGEEVYGITKFADLNRKEFSNFLGYTPRYRPQVEVSFPNITAAPDKVDWRTQGKVTPVKDQGQCGSCWAFSATEEVESSWAMGGHTLEEFSVQQIVSCDGTDGGCNGGDTISAYEYIQQAGGLESDKVYPYSSGGGNTGSCHFNKNNRIVKVTGFTYATPACTDSCNKQDEQTLADNLASKGPVSICVDAESWQFYTGGVLTSNCPHAYSDLDHCVQLVGYDKTASTPYWIVRNSWNTDWGIEGYIHVAIGKNLCGIADEATFVATAPAN